MCILAVTATFVPVFRENVSFWWLTDGTELSGLVKLAGIQVVTAAGFFVLSCFLSKNMLAASAGTVLYLTCPYRIYILFDYCDLGKCVVWALLPWLLLGLLYTEDAGRRKRTGAAVLAGFIAAAAVALTVYFDFWWFAITFVVVFLGAVYLKEARWLFLLAAGSIAGIPGILPYLDYCLRGGRDELGVQIQSIMDKGYAFGQMFTGFAYRDHLPGMGTGLFLVIVVMLWLGVVEKGWKPDRGSRYLIVAAAILTVFSLSSFPWDYVERLGSFFMRAVSALGTPTVFFGYACGLLCVVAVYVIKRLTEWEGGSGERSDVGFESGIAGFAAYVMPAFIMCISVFAAFHLGFDI